MPSLDLIDYGQRKIEGTRHISLAIVFENFGKLEWTVLLKKKLLEQKHVHWELVNINKKNQSYSKNDDGKDIVKSTWKEVLVAGTFKGTIENLPEKPVVKEKFAKRLGEKNALTKKKNATKQSSTKLTPTKVLEKKETLFK